jgi:L-lysine exporter family protein LysE/ArgO
MLAPILLGFSAGILLGLGFGSVFFALIQDSIDFGWRTGVKISLGVIIGDFLLITLAFFGTSFLPNIPHFGTYARIIGAVLLIGLGISNFRKTAAKPTPKGSSKFGKFLYYSVKGFLLNVLNPSNFLSWVVASAALKSYNYENFEEILFFVACIFSIFLTECAISYFSFKIKDKFTHESIHKFKIGTAFVFFGVAGKLIFDVLK